MCSGRSSCPEEVARPPLSGTSGFYVTAPTKGLDSLIAFDESGKQLWHASFGEENPGKHRNGSGCNPSPVTDGNNVFVNFKSGTLAAVKLDGTILWQTNLVKKFGADTLFWDHGTSPVLTTKICRDDQNASRRILVGGV